MHVGNELVWSNDDAKLLVSVASDFKVMKADEGINFTPTSIVNHA